MFFKWTSVCMSIYSPGRELGRDRHGLLLPQHTTAVIFRVALETPATLHRNLLCSQIVSSLFVCSVTNKTNVAQNQNVISYHLTPD
jgi:hypothetical protein